MKKIEDKYKVLDQISHILLRPGTYVGSNKPNTSIKNIIIDNKIHKKEVTYIPSFIKIFDEVVTNSVDEHQRNRLLNKIDVTIDRENNTISVRDNGGIPIQIHKEYNQYVPEVIFGNLMSGSNYDDTDERTVAGLNGLGSKLTNVFSKEFIVSSCDGKNHFKQTFSDNMRNKTQPIIKKSKLNHTEIIYKPDLSQFGIESIDDDHFKLIEKRVYDLAGVNPNINFTFNGVKLNFKTFEDYVKLYTDEYFYETKKDATWSLAVAPSDNGFQQISFVNSTETYDGGTHIDYILNQIISQMREFFLKKHKVDIKPNELKGHMTIFLNATVINPSFSSQTKEKLITEVKEFGTTYEVDKKTIQAILKSEIVNSILDWIQQKKSAEDSKLQRELNKKLSKLKVDKLIDAKGKDRWKCSLGLFEGDCLEENTLVRVLRDGDILDVKIKDINIGDLVITHENRYQEVVSLTKKIEYKQTIKTSVGDIVCSNKHRFWVYDTEKNEFYFEHVYNIDKNRHKLVKNQLCFMDSLLEIEEILSDGLLMKSGESFHVSNDHLLCVYNKLLEKFEMVKFIDLNKNDYFIVNTFGL
jgi:DNA topoisomerase-2